MMERYELAKNSFNKPVLIVNQDEAEKNEWTKKRHKYYPTIDQQIKDIPSVSFLFKKIENKIYPFLKEKYQIEKAHINDFFIVKYDTNYDTNCDSNYGR